jgi:hypothetical protein
MNTAPIVLFAYARPEHTQATLAALASNHLAGQSDLIVYADAARDDADIEKVNSVKGVVRSTDGFRSVTLIERNINFGLARNIIEGVTEVCNRHDRVIVMEDDIVTDRHFLTFMNSSLERYANHKKVWHISGWNYPINPEGLGDAFFWRVMNCWGWATWSDRWRHFRKSPQSLIQTWDKNRIKRFNLDGAHDFWAQVKANHAGRMDTWAIFWYATIFEHEGLCLNPTRSLVQNIGHDGSGQHCIRTSLYSGFAAPENAPSLPTSIIESGLAVDRIRAFLTGTRMNILDKAIYKFRCLIAP